MNALSFIKQKKIVSIARKISPDRIVEAATAINLGGIFCLEITFNQSSNSCIDETAKSISEVKKSLGEKMCVGAGTVIPVEQAGAAFEAGADFILAPDTNPAVISEAKKLGLICVPGAMTPTEIQNAWNLGADIVKVFPAGYLGLDYIKAVRAPISNVPLMAVGGVDEKNIKDFLNSGYCSCGIGSNIMKESLINEGKFEELCLLAKKIVSAAC
ncbi:bifunctional 4-hydroxy-2-oxoglutarate aldolase/2-dehydro-3-deoxy-phosphogluconate aldolase [Treponema pectinovorum]|uniref:bifunctional 4-hydroxy-2-oxoglutarate aldolase/2-dehydro-3-deoxy-phosphogluconate aldolase n=1 Tax=Treponema pectinovorum TaxID=164 RepID=UPI0011CA53D9|nr:bifunctional 4-hydroxy-2-oxoglutarate aldolase/2-dehydro-3-deoxy-phosphogluconate aldolase [Treponema pectinovorum]